MQAPIGATGGNQGIMGTFFGNAVLRDHDDPVGIADGGQTMRNYQCRAPFGQLIKRLLNGAFGFGIEC